MKKEEILEKCKVEGLNEFEEIIETDSLNYSLVTVMALVVFFGVWKLIHGIRSYEMMTIIAGYLATTSFYRYKKFQSKRFLVGGIITILSAIAGAIAFFMGA